MQSKPKNLKKRVFTASSWVIVGHFFTQLIRFSGNLILTRLLIPEMFGVMALVNVIMLGIAMFSDVGLLQNIVRSKRGEDPAYLNTAWVVQILRSVVIVTVVLLISAALYQATNRGWIPPTTAYGNKALPFLLAFMSAGALISGFNSIHLTLLNRKLMMGKSVAIDITSQIVGLLAMIYIAWQERSVYALVSGNIVSSAVKLFLSHILIKEKCRFAWDEDAANDIFNFGKWIFISSILGFLLAQGDRLILGILISPELLGVYTVAYFLSSAVSGILSKLLASVFYPALSDTVRNSPGRLEQIYYKIRHRVDAVAMFSSGFLYSTGNWIVEMFYDDRYHEAGWMLQILSLSMINVGFTMAGQCFLAHGRSALVTLLIGAQTLTLYIALPFAYYKYGLSGAIWTIACTPLIRLIISGAFMKIYFFFNIKKELLMVPMLLLGGLIGKLFTNIGDIDGLIDNILVNIGHFRAIIGNLFSTIKI